MSDLRAELLSRLADPRAVPILARHAIPVIGVLVFDWSVLETVAALFLDALSTLWLVAAMGAYFATKEMDVSGETGVYAHLSFWASMFGAWLVIAALLSMFVAVPAMFLLPLVQSADVDPMSLVTSGWLPRAFALMVACQLPSFAARLRDLRTAGTAPEKMGMDTEVGFVAHRTIMLAMMASMLAVFGQYALHILVILAQAFGAGTEIMRDRYVAMLAPSRHKPPGARATAANPVAGSRARRRKKR